MSKLSRAELERRMGEIEIDEAGAEKLQATAIEYLESGAVGSTLIGRYYAVNDPDQRQDFAEWFSKFYLDLVRYQNAMVTAPEEGEDDGDE